jgi:hypothetical protein
VRWTRRAVARCEPSRFASGSFPRFHDERAIADTNATIFDKRQLTLRSLAGIGRVDDLVGNPRDTQPGLGALKVVECWGYDIPDGEVTSFPMAVKCKDDEVALLVPLENHIHE